jgi:prepilin-type N-terminal cleavage/methylation domain-containing protein
MSDTRSCAGFSLVEVLCAILILGIALAGLTRGITTALGSSKESELQTSAALIAAGRVEFLRANGYLVAGENEGECEDGLSLYRWKESVAGTRIDGLYEIAVVVEHSRTGKEIYELRTLLFDPPTPSMEDQRAPRPDPERQRMNVR